MIDILETNIEKIITCYHCGEDCPDLNVSKGELFFCCDGCKVVYEILEENNLCDYYSLEQNPGTTRKNPFLKNKFEYLDDKDLIAQLIDFRNDKISKVNFNIPGMHCSSCIWLLENLFKLNQAILDSKVNFLNKQLSITFNQNQISLRGVVELLASIGYEPEINLSDIEKDKIVNTNKKLYAKIGIAGFAFGNVMLLSFPEYLSIDASSEGLKNTFAFIIFLLSLPVLFYCSSDFFVSAYKGLKKKFINIDVPLSIGIIALYGKSTYHIFTFSGPGYMDSFTGLIFFLLIGKIFQNKTFEILNFDRNYKSYFPISVTVKKEGKEKIIPLSKLQVKDRIIIRNQELIPADSILIKGEGNIDYSFVTGESIPVPKINGEMVFAGGKQSGSTIELEVVKEVSQSYLTRLWNTSGEKVKETGRIEAFSNIVSKYFTIIVLLIASISAIVWLFINPSTSLIVFTAVLIIACPCALALSTPFTLGTALRVLSKNNFYIKNTSIIETLAKVDSIVFDKTGTLTETGKSEICFHGESLTNDELVMIKSLVRNSSHPLSRELFNYCSNSITETIDEFEEKPGYGLKGIINGVEVKIGSQKIITKKEVNIESIIENNLTPNNAQVFVLFNNSLRGYFEIRNKYRQNVEEVIKELSKKYNISLLSGDNASEKTYLEKIFSKKGALHFNQTPFDKLKYVQELQANGKKVLMIGDGLNDAGALNHSDAGISVADNIAHFTPASDAILTAEEIKNLPQYLRFTKTSLNVIKTNFGISFLYNVVGISVAASGMLSPLFAAVLMPLSSITVIVIATVSVTLIAKSRGMKL